MADKDEGKQPEKEQEKPEQIKNEQKHPEYHYGYYHKSDWLLPVLIVIIIIFLAGLIGGMVAYHHERKNAVIYSGSVGLGLRGSGGVFQRGRSFNGYEIVSNNRNSVSGVVTNVSSSSFTVAGNGSTQQVTTNSSTQYQGGNQVKVNDTIIAYGTTSNGTLTATQIVINP